MVQNPIIGGFDFDQKIGRIVKTVNGGSQQQNGWGQKNRQLDLGHGMTLWSKLNKNQESIAEFLLYLHLEITI
jgi:hypothetical protein